MARQQTLNAVRLTHLDIAPSMDYHSIKAISNSSLSYLDPRTGGYELAFAQYCLGELDTNNESNALKKGRLLHHAIEKPDDIMSFDQEAPTGQLKQFVELIAEGNTPEDAFLIVGSKKFKLETFLDQIERNESNSKLYRDFIINSKGKTVVSGTEKELLRKQVMAICNNPIYQKYVVPKDNDKDVVRFSEIEIILPTLDKLAENNKLYSAPFKMKLDHLTIQKTNEGYLIAILDYKTAESTRGSKFRYSIEKWAYDRQMLIYLAGVFKAIEDGLFDSYFPGISTTPRFALNFECYLLHIDELFNGLTTRIMDSRFNVITENVGQLITTAMRLFNEPMSASQESTYNEYV